MAIGSRDRLIDDVARSMTSGAAGVDLRSAVLARIERRTPRRLTWLLVPAAVAALVVAAVGLRQSASQSRWAPGVATMAVVAPPAVPDLPAEIAPASSAGRPGRRTPPTLLPNVRTIAVLAGPAALSTSPIQPDALAIPLLNVKPIATEPLAMNAIDDGSSGRQPRF
jgi:hypothetical protein